MDERTEWPKGPIADLAEMIDVITENTGSRPREVGMTILQFEHMSGLKLNDRLFKNINKSKDHRIRYEDGMVFVTDKSKDVYDG